MIDSLSMYRIRCTLSKNIHSYRIDYINGTAVNNVLIQENMVRCKHDKQINGESTLHIHDMYLFDTADVGTMGLNNWNTH